MLDKEKQEAQPKIDELNQLKVEYQKIIDDHSTLVNDNQMKETELKALVSDKDEKIENLLKELEMCQDKLQIFKEIHPDMFEQGTQRTIVKSNMPNMTISK